jgi:hypothetical protein
MVHSIIFGCNSLNNTRVRMVCGVLCFTAVFLGLFSHFKKEAEVTEITNLINKKWGK